MSTPSPPAGSPPGPPAGDPRSAPTTRLNAPAGPPPRAGAFPVADPASAPTRRITWRKARPADQPRPAADRQPPPPHPPQPAPSQAPQPHPAAPRPPRPPRRTGRVVAIVGAVVVLLTLAGLGGYFLLAPRDLAEADLERQLTDAGSGLTSAARSTSCPGPLRAEKDRSLDCTVHLADGTDVPGRVTVSTVDGGQVSVGRRIAVLPKADLDRQLSADVARQYKAIPMTCGGDLAGAPGATTTCSGTVTSGRTVRVRATFARLGPNLEVEATFAPYLTAEDIATELEDRILRRSGRRIDVTCDRDVNGEVGATTTCSANGDQAVIAVTSVTFGYVVDVAPA